MFLNGLGQVNYGLTQSVQASLHTYINLGVAQLCPNQAQAAMAFSYFRDSSSNSTDPEIFNEKLCEPFNIDHIISKLEDSEIPELSSVESYINSLYKYVDKFSSSYTETKYKSNTHCILSGLSSFCDHWSQNDTYNKIDTNSTNEENKALNIQTTILESESLDTQTLYDIINLMKNNIINDSSIFVLLDRDIFNLLRHDPEKCRALLNNSNEEELYNNIRKIIPTLDKYEYDENAVKLAFKIMIENCFSFKNGEIDFSSNIYSNSDQSNHELEQALFSSNEAHFKLLCKFFIETLFPFDQAIENLSYYNTDSFKKLVAELYNLNVTDMNHFHARKYFYENCIDCQDLKGILTKDLITQGDTESCVKYLEAYNTFSNSTLSYILQHTKTILVTNNFSDGCIIIKLNAPKEIYYYCEELLKSIPKTSSTTIDTTASSLDTSVMDTYPSGKDASNSESISTTISPFIESGNVHSTAPELSNSTAFILDNKTSVSDTSVSDNYNTTTIHSSFTSTAILAGLSLGAVTCLALIVATPLIIISYVEKCCSKSSHSDPSATTYISSRNLELYAIKEEREEGEEVKPAATTYNDEAQETTSCNLTKELNGIIHETDAMHYSKYYTSNPELDKLLHPNNSYTNSDINTSAPRYSELAGPQTVGPLLPEDLYTYSHDISNQLASLTSDIEETVI